MAKYVRRLRMYSRRRGFKAARRRFARRGSSIKKLARAVRKIQRDVRVKAQRLNLGYLADFTLGSNNYEAINLTAYAAYDPIFGTEADDLQNNSCRHVSTGVDVLVDVNNEYDNVNYTCFVVSLRDEASTLINYSTSALSLTNGTHYTIRSGLTMLNKKYFNIHKIKRFTTGNYGLNPSTGASAAGPVGLKRWYFKIRPNMIVKNPAGNWKSLGCPRDPSQNYYLLFFNDNSILDAQNPRVQANIVSTMRA